MLSFSFAFFFFSAFSQTPSVKTFIDKSDILIGQQFKLKTSASIPLQGFTFKGLILPDSLLHFEIIEKGKIDTIAEKGLTILEQTIIFTSFDSGKWMLPAFEYKIEGTSQQPVYKLKTDSFEINVAYAPADSTNRLRDIKPIMEVNVKPNYWNILIRSALIFLVIVVIISVLKKIRKKKAKSEFSNKLSPYDEAIQLMEKLKEFNLKNPDELKQYHVKISEIFQLYITRKQQFSIMNKTSGDVLVHLSENKLSKDIITNTATALRCGDAVKFAKYIPASAESEECLTKIKETINFIHHSTTNHK